MLFHEQAGSGQYIWLQLFSTHKVELKQLKQLETTPVVIVRKAMHEHLAVDEMCPFLIYCEAMKPKSPKHNASQSKWSVNPKKMGFECLGAQ